MLWILFVVGDFGALIMLLSTIVEICFSFRKRYDVRSYAVKMLIFIGIGLVGFFGFVGIDCLSYEEVSETGNWELVAITDDVRTSGKGSGGLFYVRMSIIISKKVERFSYSKNIRKSYIYGRL